MFELDVLSSLHMLTPVLGQSKALITWTPSTFYIASGLLQTIVIWVGFRLMQVDPDNNTVIGAIIAGVVINLVAYFTRDYGLAGVLGTGAAIFGILVAVTSGEALKAAMMAAVCMAVYAGLGTVVVPRTPLTPELIGGLPAVILKGGLEAEPMETADEKGFYSEPPPPTSSP